MGKSKDDFELSDVVSRLREDLRAAMIEGAGQDIKFKLETVELELKVVAKRTGEGKAGIKFWVINAEGGGKFEREQTQTIKLKLVPELVSGGTVAISGETVERPLTPGSNSLDDADDTR